jgi:hypothetical protein
VLKNGNKIKDWKAVVRTWKANDKKWEKDSFPKSKPTYMDLTI